MSNTSPLESIFFAALGKHSDAQRRAFLDGACAGDAGLRDRVERMLAAQAEAGSFMERPAVADAPGNFGDPGDPGDPGDATHYQKLPVTEAPGTIIGRYKLLQQIGEGGFGVVYMAEQEKPVKRRVALKVIKAGMDTKAVIARFEAERQALAMMEHPNIARVLDAGATDTGRPYFVMELVKGIPVTDYCDQTSLGMRQRLELFMDVCRAVQHAHQKGVIHRDLKPSNIMVTLHDTKPVVKVIDFGIAKATDQKLTEKTVFTNYGQMIGTPAYMSPEQAVMSALDVDTRSDVYSLGVLLYELLTGSPPFDAQTLRGAGFDEMRRIIREQQPQKPSTRLSTMAEDVKLAVATQRQVSPQVLSRQLHGDLDWIILKAIEKDRSRRYDTANGLAADLQRYLDSEPILARPPSALYRVRKAARRNRLAFTATAAVAASLVVGTAASTWQAVRAGREKTRTAAALEELRASAPAFAEQAKALVEKERFDEALDKLAYAAKLRPDVPEYLTAKADVLQCQFRLAEAAATYRAALALRPGDPRARAGAALCEELLAAPTDGGGKLSRESLSKLHLAMQREQRPAAELMPVARLLGEEKKLALAYWLTRLKDLPIPADRPLDQRLTVREDGMLALDLSNTKVADLAPIAGAPLAVLDVSGATELTDISALRGMSLVALDLAATKVADLSALRDLHSLKTLSLASTPVSDLAPLRGLGLKSLSLSECPVADLSPLRGAPLQHLDVTETRVADLSPLQGMPLKSIDLTRAPVLDFTPLAGLPLEVCYFQFNRLTDLSILRGMPLRELSLWGCTDARNYSALGEIKTLELLLLPADFRDLPADDFAAVGALRRHPKLRQIGSEVMNRMDYSATGSKDLFWKNWDFEQTFVPALRAKGIKFVIDKLSEGAYSLRISNQPLADLSFLKGVPFRELHLADCQVADLTPVRELPLELLDLTGNPVTDIRPLRGMSLKTLYLHNCDKLTDASDLLEVPALENLTLPPNAGNAELLRKLPNLRRLAFRVTEGKSPLPASTTEEFWKGWDGSAWARALNQAGMKYTASQDAEGMWAIKVDAKDFSDCSVFKGAPVRELSLDNTAVSDLRPLGELSLQKLTISGTRVTDLSVLRSPTLSGGLRELAIRDVRVTDFSPLAACANLEALYAARTSLPDLAVIRGFKLHDISLDFTPVTDISALAGMPLRWAYLKDTGITDLRPLLKCPTLKQLLLPAGAKDVSALRALPFLTALSYESTSVGDPTQTAVEFWAAYDAAHPTVGE